MMAKYNLKAETGKFESKLQQPGQAKRIAAGDVVIGVVQMHDAIVKMIRALQDSNLALVELLVVARDDDLEMRVDEEGLEQLIKANNAALDHVELD